MISAYDMVGQQQATTVDILRAHVLSDVHALWASDYNLSTESPDKLRAKYRNYEFFDILKDDYVCSDDYELSFADWVLQDLTIAGLISKASCIKGVAFRSVEPGKPVAQRYAAVLIMELWLRRTGNAMQQFIEAMRARMVQGQFRYGDYWKMATNEYLAEFTLRRLRYFFRLNDPEQLVDAANGCMMLWYRVTGKVRK